MARCVADHGGLAARRGQLKVQFLVRNRGRAEGVEVLAAKGVSAEASACVRRLLKNKAIGAPDRRPGRRDRDHHLQTHEMTPSLERRGPLRLRSFRND